MTDKSPNRMLSPFAHLIGKKVTVQVKPASESKTSEPATEEKPAPTAATATGNPFLSLLAKDVPHKHEIELEAVKTNEVVIASESREELANYNTEKLEPQFEREKNLNVKAEQRTKQLILQSGEDVRTVCDKLDAAIESNPKLVGPSLIEVRGYVQRLMVTLKERPEFDSFVIDKDVRNIMRFIRSTREEALSMREVKTVKKATRAAKKEQNQIKGGNFAAAFQSIVLGDFKLK